MASDDATYVDCDTFKVMCLCFLIPFIGFVTFILVILGSSYDDLTEADVTVFWGKL